MKLIPLESFKENKIKNTIPKEYTQNILTYFKTKYPDLDPVEFEERFKDKISEDIKRPAIKIIDHKSPGNAEILELDLLEFCNHYLDEYIVAPSGTLYKKLSEKKSFIGKYIQTKLKLRAFFKTKKLDHQARGESLLAKLNDFIQSKIKIGINTLSGAMKSAYNIMYDKAGYAAITSIARHACMTSYAHAERFLANNYYFPKEKDVINWLVLTIRECPDEYRVNKVIKQWNLKVPTGQELADNFILSVKNYKRNIKREYLYSFTEKMLPHQRAFAFYCYNLANLFMHNEFAVKWFDRLFEKPEISDEDALGRNPEDIHKLDGDLVILVNSMYHEEIENMLLKDVIKDRPDLAGRFLIYADHVSQKISSLDEIFEIFFTAKLSIPDTFKQKNIIRKSVILSDTDSIIFTVVNWIHWRLGKVVLNKEAYMTSAVIVYLLSKSLVNIFATMSCQMGMEGPNLTAIAMKTELTLPVMLRTAMSKHYIANIIYQEGRRLPKPKKEIKGKNLRGSDYCATTLDIMEDMFMEDIVASYIRNLELSAADLIRKTIIFEYKVQETTKAGNPLFLAPESVQRKGHYKDPIVSKYFHYTVWRDVFSRKYGESPLPTKYRVVPLTTPITKKNVNKLTYIGDQEIFDKLVGIFDKYPNKKLNSFYIPLATDIPEEMRPLIDYRKVIHQNTHGIYLALQGFNIPLMFKKKICTFMDTYGEPILTDVERSYYDGIGKL